MSKDERIKNLELLMKQQKEQDEALINKNSKNSEQEKAKLREEARIEIENQKRVVEQSKAAHQAAINE